MQAMNKQYSVLLSLYYKEKPEYLRESLDSIFCQSYLSDDVVLVEDGNVGDVLEQVVKEYEAMYPQLHGVRFEKNRGLGYALNDGLKECRHDIVARMDTDDISKPERMEKQVRYLMNHPDVDVVGTWIDEFMGDTAHVISSRKLPKCHPDIYSYGKKRNPMNHPSVMFRKNAVIAVGGYKHFLLFEDYYLWVRMLLNGARFANLPESLLFFRTSPDMFRRRGGFAYAQVEMRFFMELKKLGYITMKETFMNVVRRLPIRILPNALRNLIYKNIIRKHNK